MDKAKEMIADAAEVGIDNVHDMDVTLRGYAEGAADAILAAMPEIIKGMVKPLEWGCDPGTNAYQTAISIAGQYVKENRCGQWMIWPPQSVDGEQPIAISYDEPIVDAAASAHNAAQVLKALSMKEQGE